MDMVSYSSLPTRIIGLHTRQAWKAGAAADRQLAEGFARATAACGITDAVAEVRVWLMTDAACNVRAPCLAH